MQRSFLPRRIAELVDVQFIRFVLVGCLNTTVGYGLFAACILLGLPSALALLIATIIGVLFNYFSTGRLVFACRTSVGVWVLLLREVVDVFLAATACLVLGRMSGSL